MVRSQRRGLRRLVAESDETEIHHFIGKDITYFHTLFWPAMLKTAGFRLPNRVQIHGFLTVDGEKMSKSKGTFINARTYPNTSIPQHLRYYYASNDPERSMGEVQDVCTIAINLFRQLAIYLTPVLPKMAEPMQRLLQAPVDTWDAAPARWSSARPSASTSTC